MMSHFDHFLVINRLFKTDMNSAFLKRIKFQGHDLCKRLIFSGSIAIILFCSMIAPVLKISNSAMGAIFIN